MALGSGTRIGAYQITAPSVDANFATVERTDGGESCHATHLPIRHP